MTITRVSRVPVRLAANRCALSWLGVRDFRAIDYAYGGGRALHPDPPALCPRIARLGGDSGSASCSFGRERGSCSDSECVRPSRYPTARTWDGSALLALGGTLEPSTCPRIVAGANAGRTVVHNPPIRAAYSPVGSNVRSP